MKGIVINELAAPTSFIISISVERAKIVSFMVWNVTNMIARVMMINKPISKIVIIRVIPFN